MARQVKITKDIKPPSLKDKAKVVKEAPTGPEWEAIIEDGDTIYKRKSANETPPIRSSSIKTGALRPPIAKKTGVPSKNDSIKQRYIPKTSKKEEEYLRVVKDVLPPTQKVQSLRTDLAEEFPSGLEKGYRSFRVPDLTTGGNYAKQKNVITDSEGMPVIYDFKQNKYIQTGEPNIHLSMPVQNDTPTIQDALNPNELPTKFDVVPERLRAPNYNKAKVTTPTVDTSIYKGFNEVGVPNTTKSDIEFQKKQSENLAVPKLNKGGLVGKVQKLYTGGPVNPYQVKNTETQGYNMNVSGNPNIQNQEQQFTNNGNTKISDNFYSSFGADKGATSGVVGQTDVYAKAKQDEDKKKKEEKDAKNSALANKAMNTVTSGLGAYGGAYYANQQPKTEGENLRNTALKTVSGMGAIGGVIGGVAGIGDTIGKPIKDSSEQLDEQGNVKDKDRAIRNAVVGITFSPSERLTYEGGLTDLTGEAYIKSVEKKRKEELAATEKLNKEGKQAQALAARDAGDFNAKIQNTYDPITGEPIAYSKGGVVGKVKQMCADGGVIKGEGGPKEDKISAKVKPGSFVVPAENTKVAETLREKLLMKAPKTKANLNQKGGREVMLSNKEHLFTKEEKEELIEKGVNVNALAPDSEHKEEEMMEPKSEHNSKEEAMEKKSHIMFPNVIGYDKGGVVDPAKELAKIESERKAIEAIKAKKESDQSAAEKARLQKFILEARATNQANKTKEWEKKYNDSKTKLDALNKSYEDASKEFKEGSTPSANQKGVKAGMGTVSQRKYKEDLLKKIQEAKSEHDNAKRTYDYVKSGKTYAAPKTENKAAATQTETKTATTEVPKTTTTKPSLKAPRVSVPNTSKFVAPAVVDNGEDVVVPNGNLSPNEAARIKATEDKATADATALNNSLPSTYTPTTTPTTTPTKKRSGLLDRIGNVDPTALVGIGQSAVGYNMLKDEKRPVDKAVLDATYNGNVNRAIQDAKFGLTPEQRFAAEQDIQNGLNDAKAVGLNYSGGSGVQAFNTNRAAINDAWKNKLGLKQADTEMRMNKQMYADQQVANRANILAQNRRRSFEDAMSTFQQKQQAGSELIGAGFANTIGAYRYNKDLQAQKEANLASNEWTRQYGQTM